MKDEEMLLLWDHVIEPYEATLKGLGGRQLLGLALDVIEGTLRLLDPPFPGFFPPEHAALINLVTQGKSLGLDGPAFGREFSGEVLRRYDSLPEVAVRPAVGPFLMSIVRLFEAGPDSLDEDDVLEILSSCYESILMSQLTGRVTLEDQESNSRCREAIELQVNMISKYQAPER